MSVSSRVIDTVKRHFLSGVLIVVPLILTYIVLKFLFETIDGILQPIIFKLFGYFIPGLGVFTTLLLIILAGMFTRNYLGHKLYKYSERLLVKMPVIRPIYSSAKQLLEAVTISDVKSFKEVGLVEYPRKGVYALCFIARTVKIKVEDNLKNTFTVFIPSTPTPVSGMVILVPREDVILLDMTIEDGVKFLVSGGVASPDVLLQKKDPGREEIDEVNSETC
ncbi:MAG: DUF502 domain-containing protein [candidate division Zixibacteria bacterium]|nr:DUF502 domain-containing protein [candidate division Zixibacteria bacterium]